MHLAKLLCNVTLDACWVKVQKYCADVDRTLSLSTSLQNRMKHEHETSKYLKVHIYNYFIIKRMST